MSCGMAYHGHSGAPPRFLAMVENAATECSLRRRSQVVRQRFAKPPFVSSSLTGASRKTQGKLTPKTSRANCGVTVGVTTVNSGGVRARSFVSPFPIVFGFVPTAAPRTPPPQMHRPSWQLPQPKQKTKTGSAQHLVPLRTGVWLHAPVSGSQSSVHSLPS